RLLRHDRRRPRRGAHRYGHRADVPATPRRCRVPQLLLESATAADGGGRGVVAEAFMPGIRDRVAVAGVGATRFTEHWEKDQEDLLVEAVEEACADAGIVRKDIQAIWCGVYYRFTGLSGTTAAD